MERIGVTMQTETVDGVLEEIMPLLQKHYAEIAWKKDKIPLDPDYDAYRRLEKAKILRIFTARSGGTLVGYAIWMVTNNPHYKSMRLARSDIFYVEPSRRGAMMGQRLIKYSESELKKDGVNVIGLHIKTTLNWQRLAEHWGYEHTDVNMHKWLGD